MAAVYISVGQGDKVADKKDKSPALISRGDRQIGTKGLLWVRVF